MVGKPKGKHMKYNTPKARRELWDELCKHLRQGLSLKTFPMADEDTLYKYTDMFPEDCPTSELNDAKRACVLFWEKIGIAGATGKLAGFNAAAWIFNMKNRAGWVDRIQNDQQFLDKDGQPADASVTVRYVE